MRRHAHRATRIASVVLSAPIPNSSSRYVFSHLGSRHRPNLVVVRPHEDVRNALTGIPQNPLIEVLRLGVCHSCVHRRVNNAIHALDLVLLRQHGDVVLEGVRDPEALVADVGDTLVLVPVGLLGERLVDAVVEVLVVGKDNVAADIVELMWR